MRLLRRALITSHWGSYKKRKFGFTETPGVHIYRGTAMQRGNKRLATSKPRREESGEITPADTLILDFLPPEL